MAFDKNYKKNDKNVRPKNKILMTVIKCLIYKKKNFTHQNGQNRRTKAKATHFNHSLKHFFKGTILESDPL